METQTSFNEALEDSSKGIYVSGPNLYNYYSRTVNSKINTGDIIGKEYASKKEELVSPEKEVCGSYVTTGTQTDFRESETQTDPWDPPFVLKKIFKDPEVLHLKGLTYGKGLPVTQTEINYILESRQNRDSDVPSEGIIDYETFTKQKQLICTQFRNKWNYKISKGNEELVDKLKQMEAALAQEISVKSERQERLLKNVWTQKIENMSKVNSKLQKELNKELKVLEKRYKVGDQKFDPKAYELDKTTKKIACHINESRESLNRDIDHLISKYHMNPKGLAKLTGWLEKKRTILYSEIPLAKPFQKTESEKLIEEAYVNLLASKHTTMPPKVYKDDYEEEETVKPEIKSEIEYETLKLPEEGVDLVTVWQQALRGRAYQKQMLELIAKHKDSLDVLLSSQIKL